MAKKSDPLSFNFGANATKPKKPKKPRTSKSGKTKGGGRGNAWTAYIGGGISNAPIPD